MCYAFSLPPTAFTAQTNRATAENAQDVALAEGLQPLQNWVKHLIDRVIAEEFGAGDLEFAWDADSDADPSATATIATDYVKAGIKSINEVRAELGLPPVAGGEQPKIQTAQGLVPLTTNASAAPATKAGETLRRYNENHYGPGDRGGQFAPSGESDESTTPTHATDAPGTRRNSLVVPVQYIEPPPTTVLDAVRGLKPETPPGLPPTSNLPAIAEPPTGEPSVRPEPSSSAEPGTSEENNETPFEIPPEQPAGPDNTPYQWGRKIGGAINNAISSGDFKAAESIAIAADSAAWLKDQAANIIASFDSPKDLSDLQEAATNKDSDPGYQDHHIVEQGPQNNDLSPEDQERIDDDDNIVRIPYYAHRDITAYYQRKQKALGDLTPRQYLRGKTFEERYNFGLDTLKKFGVLRK